MFWPFTKWTNAPAPWGPSKWNTPEDMRQSSFMSARRSMYPKYASRVAQFFTTPVPRYWTSPSRVYGAISKHPADAMNTVAEAHAQLRGLAEHALGKHLAGLPLSQDEGRALIAVYMPPVVRPQERTGVGVVPDWDIPPRDRSTIPDAVLEQQARLQNPAEAMRQLAVGSEIARIASIRQQWMNQAITRNR